MLPTQTFSFAASEHRNITVVGREKISCASDTAKDTFLIVECVIPTPGRCFHFRVAFKTMISNDQGNFSKVNGRMPRPQRYVFIKNIPS